MPINPSLAKKYAEFRGITEQDLADAYGDDEKQLEADLQSEGLTAADFDEPSVGIQPAAPEPPSEGEVVRRLVNYGRKGQKEAALANEEIDRRFMAAKERGEDYAGVDEYVRRNLGGSKRRSALDRLVSGMSNVRRTVTAPLETAATAIATAVLKPEEVFDKRAPVLAQNVRENISQRVQSNQFSEIDAAARKADKQKAELEQALAESQMGQQAGDATSAPRTGYAAPEPGFAQSLVDVAKEAASNPREFAIRTAGELTTPANIATEAAAPFVGLGAGVAGRTVANAARRTRLGRAVGMDPLAMTGAIRRPSLTKMAAGEGLQAAGSELLETGDVTAAGTAAGIAPAVAGTVVRRALTPRLKAEGAAARPETQPALEPTPEPIAATPGAAPIDGAQPPVEASAQPVEVPAQPSAQVAPEQLPEVKPLQTRNNRPRNTEETRAAKEIARKDAMRAKADAESKINNHTKKAISYAKQGEAEFAEKLLDNARADYDILWGDLAEQVFTKDKELLRKEAQATASKRQPKLNPPKTMKEAEAQVQQAIDAGTLEAIEAARPAIEALHPVAEDAAKVADDLKAAVPEKIQPAPAAMAEAPTPKAPAKVAPELKKKKAKAAVEPKEDPTVRPVIVFGKNRQELSSVSDRTADAVDANAADHMVLSEPGLQTELKKLGRHKLANDLKQAVDSFDRRVATEIESSDGPKTLGELADDMSMEFGEDIGSAISDPTNVLIDEFAERSGVSRQDLVDAFQAAQYTKEERKVINKVIAELREGVENTPEEIAARNARRAEDEARLQSAIDAEEEAAGLKPAENAPGFEDVKGWGRYRSEKSIVRLGSMGGALPLEKIPEQLGSVAKLIDDNVLFHGQRISDEFTELTNEAMKRGGPQAAETLNDLLLETRKIDNASDRRISSFFAKINAELRKIPEVGIGIRGLDVISDALDGRKVELNEWQQRIHDVIREALDDLGADYERVTGNPMRKDYFPRVEEKALIRQATASFKKQYDSAGAAAELTDGPMTFKKAASLKSKIREIKDPLAAEAIRNQTEVLKSLFEKDKDGNIALKLDETGKPLVNREAAYLLMIPEDGELPPMLPDLFASVGTKIDEELNGEPVYGPPYHAIFKTGIKYPEGEALDDLLNAESMRLLANREDYDPDSKSRSFHATNGRWQMDGSLTNARMMPNLGDRFYDRNPINVIAHIIPRQVRGLQRQETFGLKKENLLSKLQSLDGTFSPQELGLIREGDKYRLATKKDGAAYDRSLLRSIEDVAMGYVRPFTEEKWYHRLFDGAGKIARYAVLTGKLINTAANEIAQAGAAAAYSPAVGTAYAAARARVAKAQMESGGRRVLESGVRASALPLRALEAAGSTRTAKLGRDLQKAALKRLVDGDPIVQADIRAMSDASTMVGATAAERALNGIQNLVGSFASSNKAADIASHYAGFSMFNDLIARRTEDPSGFKKEAGLLEEDLRRTVSEKDMDEAASLLDSAGWPKDANAAERILQLAGPFISEMKSKMSGRSSPLFQTKFARQRWARSAMWLAMIPFSIASGQLAGIRRAFKAGNKIEGAKRIAKLGAASAGVGYLTLLAKANPQMAAAIGATVTGQFPALAAATSIAGEFDPNETPGEAALAALESDWNRGDDTPEQLYNKALTLAGLAAKGFSWKPRMMEPDMLTSAEASLAGQRKFTPRVAETLAQMALPGTMALAQTGAQMGRDIGLMSTGSALPLTMGLFMPSVREAMGNRRINLQAQKQFNAKIDPETINEKSQPLSEAGAAGLIKAGVDTRVKKLPRN